MAAYASRQVCSLSHQARCPLCGCVPLILEVRQGAHKPKEACNSLTWVLLMLHPQRQDLQVAHADNRGPLGGAALLLRQPLHLRNWRHGHRRWVAVSGAGVGGLALEVHLHRYKLRLTSRGLDEAALQAPKRHALPFATASAAGEKGTEGSLEYLVYTNALVGLFAFC